MISFWHAWLCVSKPDYQVSSMCKHWGNKPLCPLSQQHLSQFVMRGFILCGCGMAFRGQGAVKWKIKTQLLERAHFCHRSALLWRYTYSTVQNLACGGDEEENGWFISKRTFSINICWTSIVFCGKPTVGDAWFKTPSLIWNHLWKAHFYDLTWATVWTLVLCGAHRLPKAGSDSKCAKPYEPKHHSDPRSGWRRRSNYIWFQTF